MKQAVAMLSIVCFAGLASANSGDGTLQHYIRNSELILSGKIVSEVIGEQEEVGVRVYQLKIEIAEVLHGTAPGKAAFSFYINRFELRPGDDLPYMKRNTKCIFLLKKAPYWREADMWFGVQPYNSHMANRIKELSKQKK